MRTGALAEIRGRSIVRSAPAVPATSHPAQAAFKTAPDPEVSDQAERRQFTAKYKLRILQELDRCSEPGQVGILLEIPRI